MADSATRGVEVAWISTSAPQEIDCQLNSAIQGQGRRSYLKSVRAVRLCFIKLLKIPLPPNLAPSLTFRNLFHGAISHRFHRRFCPTAWAYFPTPHPPNAVEHLLRTLEPEQVFIYSDNYDYLKEPIIYVRISTLYNSNMYCAFWPNYHLDAAGSVIAPEPRSPAQLRHRKAEMAFAAPARS